MESQLSILKSRKLEIHGQTRTSGEGIFEDPEKQAGFWNKLADLMEEHKVYKLDAYFNPFERQVLPEQESPKQPT